MRNPKKGKGKKEAKPPVSQGAGTSQSMDTDQSANAGQLLNVWRPGIDPIAEDEELDYDPTAYDCLHAFTLEWPCLSFDLLRDDLGGPRTTFPHTLFMVTGTQADAPRKNHLALLKLANLGQGRHGKRDKKEGESESDEESEESEGMSDDEGGEDEEKPRMHVRIVPQNCATNRIRSMPQKPGLIAVWGDNGQVRVLDTTEQFAQLAAEQHPQSKTASKVQINPLQSHQHAEEGFAVDWSPVKAGMLATGDCKKHIHVWTPHDGPKWQVSSPYCGHSGSVEDIQWSPTEETVFASCSVDKTIRIWDTREKSRSMLDVTAHDTDVNVISWNRLVTYMLASGADDGALRIWDLRAFKEGGFVSHFTFHRSHISSVEWSPYESSMLATCAGDNQLAVWDLALERDPEEERALAPAGNAMAPEDLPAQLLFVHAGQKDPKELHWHAQIPGLLVSTALDGFNVFKPSNV